MTEKNSGAANVRVYSYVAEDGTVFWSFTKLPQTVSPTRRLVLQNRRGTLLAPLIAFLREQAALISSSAPVEEESSTGK